VPIPPDSLPAFRMLLRAAEYAEDAGGDPWQFAVEWEKLEAAGMTRSDLRWLLAKQLALQAHEATVPGDEARSFRPLAATASTKTACVLLTGEGVFRLRDALHAKASPAASFDAPGKPATAGGEPHQPAPDVPEWDPNHRELLFRGQLVKRFRVPAPNQELILAAFEEEGWPQFIDDPLIPEADQEPKKRLLATIKSLNRNQIAPLLRFHGNGNGRQVYWEPVNQVRAVYRRLRSNVARTLPECC
jgi:hypothetical protein